MCNVCGCGEGEARVEQGEDNHKHTRQRHDQPNHVHHHAHDHDHNHDDLHFGHGPARGHVPGFSQTQMLQIEQNILGKNDRYAEANLALLKERQTLTLNLVSSPGSGKTTLLTATINQLKDTVPVAVIEGDQETVNDAERIRETGVPAVQINTGKGCHLDAHMVGHALDQLTLESGGVLFIENVGNLVCPASFALGENFKVAILSVAEGDDKPLKYPDMFAASEVMIINKIDLLPYVDFDVERCIEYARRVNPAIRVLQLSARTYEGLDTWIEWIMSEREHVVASRVGGQESELRA